MMSDDFWMHEREKKLNPIIWLLLMYTSERKRIVEDEDGSMKKDDLKQTLLNWIGKN